ncbi:MAG: PQQ-dependent sugar dehydrogenase, partial [Acidobacteria bacterium]|nr:PQQ-dependent sugar dehydrogenase [Acidobacteriota bacterium]
MCFTALLLLASAPAFPQASGRVRLVEVARGFSSPVDIAHAGDASGRLFVVEQRGRIRIVRDNALLPAPFLDISARVSCCGERGLLGLAFPPGFREKQHF